MRVSVVCRLLAFSSVTFHFACGEAEFSSNEKEKRNENVATEDAVLNQEDQVLVQDPPPPPPPKEPRSITQNFLSNNESMDKYSFTLSNKYFAHDVTLKQKYADLTKKFDQTDRPQVTKTFKQGAGGTPYAEEFLQSPFSGVVDILIVIDNSGSMAQEQLNLSTKLQPLLEEIKDANWQIAVVTTDPGNGCMRALIKKGDANFLTAFQIATTPGIGGNGNEQGVRMAVEGLACPTSPWVRNNSSLAVLLVSDEDNCSNGFGCGNYPWGQASYLTNHLSVTMGRKLGVDARVYGIFKHPTDNACNTAAERAVQYSQLVEQTGGVYGSICDLDYTQTLRAISRDIAALLKTQFMLKDKPDPGSLKVMVNNALFNDFTLEQNVITFTKAPPPNAKINLSYVTGKEPQLKEFGIEETPAAGTLSVTVNGNAAEGTYAFDGNTYKIIFANSPEPSADIKVVYRKNIPLALSFNIGSGVVANSVKVNVNGNASNDFNFDPANGLVVFNNPPTDAAKIAVNYKMDQGPVLDYALALLSTKIVNLKAVDKDNGNPVKVAYADGILSVDAADHKEGKVITVTYLDENSTKKEIQLPHAPLPGTLVITTDTECKLDSGVILEGDKLLIDCIIPDNSMFAATFDYELNLLQVFEMLLVPDPNAGSWKVVVDGTEVTDFQRQGRSIILRDDLPHGSKVEITYTFKEE